MFAAVGFCGSLTTISSFALETSDIIDNRQFGNVAINILANIGLSIEQDLAAGCLQKRS